MIYRNAEIPTVKQIIFDYSTSILGKQNNLILTGKKETQNQKWKVFTSCFVAKIFWASTYSNRLELDWNISAFPIIYLNNQKVEYH